MHDWQMEATRVSGSFRVSEESGERSIKGLLFEVAVAGLSAEKPKMERDAKDALGADRYPTIRFEQAEPLLVASGLVSGEAQKAELAGYLFITGKRRYCEIPLTLRKRNDDYLMSGEAMLDMTDYGLSPPKALLGMIKTGEEIVVHYELWWIRD